MSGDSFVSPYCRERFLLLRWSAIEMEEPPLFIQVVRGSLFSSFILTLESLRFDRPFPRGVRFAFPVPGDIKPLVSLRFFFSVLS